jgi:AcrR family transcriptional regulator
MRIDQTGGSGRTPRRRTQAERRSTTSGLLLEAAIACLVDRGYAATTTLEVARRAGVSQGALFKHYRTKVALLVAAVERLYARLREDFRRDLAEAEQRRDRIRAALELLDAVFARAEVAASLELHMAARTDAELRAAFEPVAAEHHGKILALARELFPAAEGRSRRFDTFIDLAVDVLQGAAVGALAHPAPSAHSELLDALEWLARRELGDAVAPAASGEKENT